MGTDPALSEIDPRTLTRSEWQEFLSPLQAAILRDAATERAWTGPWLDEERPGAYHCAGCGQKLYEAGHKFHSGCGWPSFFQEVAPGAIRTLRDDSHGMVRTEMRCARCDGHLGHIFRDAPQTPTGLRHCVNGHALIFVPAGDDPLEVLQRSRRSSRNDG